MKLARFARRSLAVTAAALIALATFAPDDADARAGRSGSFGSRGSRTFDAPPPTATAPGAQQMQRTQSQPNVGAPSAGAQRPATQAQQPGRFGGMFGGGLMAGVMGGLLGAGLFGLLTGSGFLGGLGSLASMLGLIIQVVLVVLVVRFAINWFRRRQEQGSGSQGSGSQPSAYGRSTYQPSPAGVGAGSAPASYQPSPVARPVLADVASTNSSSDRFDYPSGSPGQSSGPGYGAPSQQSGEVTIETSDYDAFERMLRNVQDAWTRQDMGALRELATHEMYEMFTDDLAEMSREGVVNRVSDVKLLQGDLAESWSENGEDYATVAMRYELVDVTEDVRTREVVDGDPSRPTEATELWTFVRPSAGGEWRLSAVQQAEEQKKSSGWFG